MDLTAMGKRIKEARSEKRLTLEKLSENIGISRNFLWEIESGRKAPALQTLYAIARELGISADYLLGLSAQRKWIAEDAQSIYEKIAEIVGGCKEDEARFLYRILKAYQEEKNA